MATRPTAGRYKYGVAALDGGLNTKYTDYNTPPNQSPALQNVELDDFGAVGTCAGYSKLTTSSIASYPIDGLHTYINTAGNAKLMAVCASNLYTYESTGWNSIASAASMYTANQRVNMVTADNFVFVNNGYATPMKWDGTHFRNIGVPAPDTGSVGIASAGTGQLNGSYKYALTGVNSYSAESDYTIVSSTFVTITSGQVQLSSLPTFQASAGVETKRIYRTKATTTDTYYLVASTAPAATSYLDNTPDASISAEAPSDNGQPPAVQWMIYHRNRAFGAGNPTHPSRLYFSNKAAVETWPSTNYIDINEGDGEPITGLAIYGNALFIHKNSGNQHGTIWMLHMPDSSDVTGAGNWYLSQVNVADGAVGHDTITFYNDLMFYLNRYGAYGFTGSDLAKSPAYSSVGSFPVDQLSFLIEPDVKDWKVSRLGTAVCLNYEYKVWCAVPKGSGATRNNQLYVFDYLRATSDDRRSGAWTIRSAPNVSKMIEYDGSLYAGSANDDGYIYKLNTSKNYDDEAINSFFYTIWLPGRKEHQDYTKIWRLLNVWVKTSGNWNLNVTYWVDFEGGSGTTGTISLDSGGYRWDQTFIWDETPWGGGANRKYGQLVLRRAVGKVIQFKFWINTVDQDFKIYNLETEYNLRGRR